MHNCKISHSNSFTLEKWRAGPEPNVIEGLGDDSDDKHEERDDGDGSNSDENGDGDGGGPMSTIESDGVNGDENTDEWKDSKCGAWAAATQLAHDANIVLQTPRVVTRQTGRTNVPSSTVEEYYKRAVWFPYLDSIIVALKDKFSAHQLTVMKLSALVPSVIEAYNWSDLEDSYKLYQLHLASEPEVRSEYLQWKHFCLQMSPKDRPATPLEALDIVPARFPNIKILLKIFETLPVTSCTPERAFSAMKLLKNNQRSTMTDERLTGLALMYIHPDIEINIDNVIDRYVSSGKRRLSH